MFRMPNPIKPETLVGNLGKSPTNEEQMISLLRILEHNTRMANNFLYKILEKLSSIDKKVKP